MVDQQPIRIAHISDTHLGYRALGKTDPVTGRNQRTVDVERAFECAIDDILERKPDLIIHGGDVFQHTRPTWYSLRHFIRQMRRIEDAGIPTVVIGGNHDTPRLRTGGSVYSVLDLALPSIHFVTDYEDRHLPFRDLGLMIQAIPHGALTNPDRPLSMVTPGPRNVLVCHGMTPGILDPGQVAEPGEETINSALLDPAFDYIALGHYHIHMQAAAKAWYSGSTERFGFGDREAQPGYLMVTLRDPGDSPDLETIALPARPMVSLKPVYGDGQMADDIANRVLDQLRGLEEPEAMVRMVLRDIDRPTRRETETMIRRQAEEHVWSLTIGSEGNLLLAAGETVEGSDEQLDIPTLFREFVEVRKGTYFNDRFAEAFLARGGQALQHALEADEAPTPEEDGAV